MRRAVGDRFGSVSHDWRTIYSQRCRSVSVPRLIPAPNAYQPIAILTMKTITNMLANSSVTFIPRLFNLGHNGLGSVGQCSHVTVTVKVVVIDVAQEPWRAPDCHAILLPIIEQTRFRDIVSIFFWINRHPLP